MCIGKTCIECGVMELNPYRFFWQGTERTVIDDDTTSFLLSLVKWFPRLLTWLQIVKRSRASTMFRQLPLIFLSFPLVSLTFSASFYHIQLLPSMSHVQALHNRGFWIPLVVRDFFGSHRLEVVSQCFLVTWIRSLLQGLQNYCAFFCLGKEIYWCPSGLSFDDKE